MATEPAGLTITLSYLDGRRVKGTFAVAASEDAELEIVGAMFAGRSGIAGLPALRASMDLVSTALATWLDTQLKR